MKVFLLHRDQDFSVAPELDDTIFGAMRSGHLYALPNAQRELERRRRIGSPPETVGKYETLIQDLELETLWNVMAAGDEFLYQTARRAVLSGLSEPADICYRQRVLADCLDHPEVIDELYEIAVEALARERDVSSWWSGAMPDWIVRRSVHLLGLYVQVLRRLRKLAEEHGESFRSEGFRRFFAMVREELSDDYLETVESHLGELKLEGGVLQSAGLGKGDKAKRWTFHEPPAQPGWKQRWLPGKQPPSYSFELHPRDEAGFRALTEIKGKALNSVADAVAQSADHVQSFFVMLRLELAFYLGCLNLHRSLERKGEPICFPEPMDQSELVLNTRGLYDVCLTLHLTDPVIGNDVDADGRALVMLTGANQGGKSTLLRSLGLAQLMMQSGMFVGAQSFSGTVCAAVLTHYKREEAAAMGGGKLDEELSRMSAIVDSLKPGSLLLCNESFASTNEREGSEIARQVVRALLDSGIRVIFVTHMYDLAHGFYDQRLPTTLFLRAEREPDGRRTFKLREGKPLPTSYGEDSYRRVFAGTQASPTAIESRI